jgi:hypothetical protein
MLFLATLFSALLIGAGTAQAYEQYSQNGDATNCRECHGDFRASPYTSLSDDQSWEAGLHDVHRYIMLDGDCETCHGGGSDFPVLLNFSDGGIDLAPISCVGCHGRAEDGVGIGGFGAGLRQHHFTAGEEDCLDCHDDSDPDNFDTADEGFRPPYYADPGPDLDHPDMPSDPCNPQADGFPEDYAGSTWGLDNDGNGIYDEFDGACAGATATVAVDTIVAVAVDTTVDLEAQMVRLDFTDLPPYIQIRLEGVTALYWSTGLDGKNPSSLMSSGFTVNGANLEMKYEGAAPPTTNYITYSYLDGLLKSRQLHQ